MSAATLTAPAAALPSGGRAPVAPVPDLRTRDRELQLLAVMTRDVPQACTWMAEHVGTVLRALPLDVFSFLFLERRTLILCASQDGPRGICCDARPYPPDFVVLIRHMLKSDLQRFLIAHELGHAYAMALGRDQDDLPRNEREADTLASLWGFPRP